MYCLLYFGALLLVSAYGYVLTGAWFLNDDDRLLEFVVVFLFSGKPRADLRLRQDTVTTFTWTAVI